MIDYIHELYQHALMSGRLVFEDDPGYRDALSRFGQQYELIWQAGDHRQCEQLYSLWFDLAYFSGRAAFSQGAHLGMGLMGWSGTGLSGL